MIPSPAMRSAITGELRAWAGVQTLHCNVSTQAALMCVRGGLLLPRLIHQPQDCIDDQLRFVLVDKMTGVLGYYESAVGR